MTDRPTGGREALAAALGVWDGTLCIWDTGLDGVPLDQYVDATEAIAAAARERLAQLPETCERCNGAGSAGDDTHLVERTEDPCSSCHGKGTVYPPALVERIAETIREESKDWFGEDWQGLADEAEDLAVAVLDALNMETA